MSGRPATSPPTAGRSTPPSGAARGAGAARHNDREARGGRDADAAVGVEEQPGRSIHATWDDNKITVGATARTLGAMCVIDEYLQERHDRRRCSSGRPPPFRAAPRGPRSSTRPTRRTWWAARASGPGTPTATSTATSSATTPRSSWATRTPRSSRRSPRRSAAPRPSPRRRRWRSSWRGDPTPAAVGRDGALHELRDRVDDVRDPGGAGLHGPRPGGPLRRPRTTAPTTPSWLAHPASLGAVSGSPSSTCRGATSTASSGPRGPERDVAAMIIEPVQGAGGVRLADPAFLRSLGEMAAGDRRGPHLRRGHRVPDRSERRQGVYGVTPDLTTLGKIVGGGYAPRHSAAGPRSWTASTPAGPTR